MSRRVPAALVGLACAVSLAAGCGSQQSKLYTATGTAPCLREQGFRKVTTNSSKVGFIAGFADNGGLRAVTADDNVLTIAFTGSESDVPGTKRAFTRQAAPQYKHHMQDIMESQRNAVLVWTVTPSQQQLDDVLGCLHS
jgi:hypothetical protein